MPSIGIRVPYHLVSYSYLSNVSDKINGKDTGVRFLVGNSRVEYDKDTVTMYAVIQPNVPKMYLFGLVLIIIYLLTGWAVFWILGAALGLTYIFWMDYFYYFILRSNLKKLTKDETKYLSKAQIVLSLIED